VLENEQPQNVETARNTRRPMTRLITSTTGETHRLTPPKTVPKPPSLALCFVTLPESKKPITGHIDVVQARNGFIHLLDYKPKAREIDPVNQLVVHALVFASRARLPVKVFKCAWFGDKDHFEFSQAHGKLAKLPVA
jgi:hypothetical protein